MNAKIIQFPVRMTIKREYEAPAKIIKFPNKIHYNQLNAMWMMYGKTWFAF